MNKEQRLLKIEQLIKNYQNAIKKTQAILDNPPPHTTITVQYHHKRLLEMCESFIFTLQDLKK